ncbi:hypothetical protein ACQ4PT_025723 [Festuca glaucescens]
MASSRRALPVATLALRILSLLFLIASVVIIATAKVQADDTFFDEPDTTFKNVYAYRFVLAVGVIGCAYSLLAISFVAINLAGGKKMIGGTEGGTVLLICADVVCAVLIAAGGAAGLGLTVEAQRLFGELLDSSFKTFFNQADISSVALLLASLCVVAIVMLSVYSLTK